MPLATALMFAAGGALLVLGAELLVRGASRLAAALGISPLVIGLTVVALATSSPELAVALGAAGTGQGELALGAVVGSNIFNILFILGLSALVAPLVVSERLVRLDVPLMLGASVLVLLLALDGGIGRVEGALLVGAILAYSAFLIRGSRRRGGGEGAVGAVDGAGGDGPAPARAGRRWADVALMALGLGLLALGSRWLLDAAVSVAAALGASELVIGLTIVAAGTSLPELATSVLASLRGERDIAVGNVVGSNLFNLLAVLGASSMVSPGGLPVPPGALTFDLPVMIVVSLATLPIFFTGYAIERWEGLLFLAFYAAYTLFLILDAARHPAVDELRAAMIYFVLPLTALTLAVLALRARGQSERPQIAPRVGPD